MAWGAAKQRKGQNCEKETETEILVRKLSEDTWSKKKMRSTVFKDRIYHAFFINKQIHIKER